ncbi:MAG TPA: NADH-quinone oxidoreductase subunit C [Desulfomonilaceae bacterium]|nr:NADH-quinone oxidoreductase subunit C [Desulfomonilaceae bacterium]
MKQELIKDKLISEFGEDAVKTAESAGQIYASVPKEQLLEICRFLKNDPELAFDFLSFMAGVDRYPASPRFETVYQLYSIKHNHRFRIKVHIDEPSKGLPSVESVAAIWPTADWHERETAEMYGISFNNHPDPRKLLTPDNWTVYPLRKDFSVLGTEEDTPDLP